MLFYEIKGNPCNSFNEVASAVKSGDEDNESQNKSIGSSEHITTEVSSATGNDCAGHDNFKRSRKKFEIEKCKWRSIILVQKTERFKWRFNSFRKYQLCWKKLFLQWYVE